MNVLGAHCRIEILSLAPRLSAMSRAGVSAGGGRPAVIVRTKHYLGDKDSPQIRPMTSEMNDDPGLRVTIKTKNAGALRQEADLWPLFFRFATWGAK